MNQKHIGIILIIIGILMSGFLFISKSKEDQYIKEIMLQNESCFLEDGTCLHADRDITIYILGAIISASLTILGVYLIFFDKTQKILSENQILISEALVEAKRSEKNRDEFAAFLSGFNVEEQKILKAIREQTGIKQSTLRFRVDMSKTALSLALKSLESRKIISKKASGKSNQLFLIKKF